MKARARVLMMAAAVSAGPAGAATSCDALRELVLSDTTITSAALAPEGHCRVEGVVAPANRFEVWLPTTGWNGKFQGVGNGGLGGYVNVFGMGPALRRGYATAGTDAGHGGGPFDGTWALGRPDLLVDFAHRGVHEATRAAKAIVEAFYGVPPVRSYFVGCSTGGRQGLIEAQRYPEDYDGIVVGAPAAFFTHLAAGSNWVSQALQEDPASIIPARKLPHLASAVLAACDARDGLVDGLVGDPRRCRFDPARLRCRGADADTCLTAAQVRGLKKVYRGPRTSSGKRIFPGHPPGGEVGSGSEPGPAGEPALGGWEVWIAGEAPGLQNLIQDAFFKYLVFEDPAWDWRGFDFDRDVRPTDAKLAALLNGTDPDLEPFAARGGKIVMYHGWSDPGITPLATIDYWERVAARTRRRARHDGARGSVDDFLRLFLAPGMQHCAGGPGPNTFDAVGALERWVEQGVAPDRIVAAHRTGGVVDRTRPLCPHPLVARWDGVGSPDDAASFSCARPRRRRAGGPAARVVPKAIAR